MVHFSSLSSFKPSTYTSLNTNTFKNTKTWPMKLLSEFQLSPDLAIDQRKIYKTTVDAIHRSSRDPVLSNDSRPPTWPTYHSAGIHNIQLHHCVSTFLAEVLRVVYPRLTSLWILPDSFLTTTGNLQYNNLNRAMLTVSEMCVHRQGRIVDFLTELAFLSTSFTSGVTFRMPITPRHQSNRQSLVH